MRFIILFFVAIVAFGSCKKETSSIVSTAEFTINKNAVYMYEPLELHAVDTTGFVRYHYDFGDGHTATGGHTITHQYDRGGNFVVKMSVDGKTFSRNIRVHAGVLSYQIWNKAKRELSILSYIDNTWIGSVHRNDYNGGQLGDTIFAYSGFSGGGSLQGRHIFSASLFTSSNIENVLYTPNFFWFNQREHQVFEITDSTLTRPRHGYLVCLSQW